MIDKGFLKIMLVCPTVAGFLNIDDKYVLKSQTSDVTSVIEPVTDLNHSNLATNQDKLEEKFLANEQSIKRIKNALDGRGAYKPYTVFKREMSKIKSQFFDNFVISCALAINDTEKMELLDSITLSGDNYKQSWFKSLLYLLKKSDYAPLRYKATSLLVYHFRA